MKSLRYILLMLISLTALAAAARSIDDIPNVQLRDSTRFVSDPDGYMSADAIARADSLARNIRRETTAEVVAIIVKDLDGEDIDRYAIDLTEKWGIGKSDKDNGVLVLVSIDDRQAGIYTGYGVEGIVTDMRAGRIRRDIMNPALKAGDYGGAIVNTLQALNDIMTQPDAAEELRSDEPNRRASESYGDFFRIYLIIAALAFVIMAIIALMTFMSTRGMERHERFNRLNRLTVPFIVGTVAFLGIPILACLLLVMLKKRVRRSVPACPNCGHKMRLIDEVHDNDYLTPAQDREEQLNSVDYDVWLCDNCGTTEISPYVNDKTAYSTCPSCGARTEQLIDNTVVRKPTTESEGVGEKTYLCHNCNNRRRQAYRIAKLATPPIVILPGGMGKGGGFGGGGFGGGGFGGGSFGGGGSSGGW